jgi:DHA2 family multidrug resistance protein
LSPTEAGAAAGPAPEARLTPREVVLVFAVVLATVLEIIDTSIVNVALPDMMGSLGATLDEVDWVITGYMVSNVVVIPMTAWLAARFGRKRYFVASILFFTAASFLCGMARTLPELVVFRVLQGLGGGALLATSQSIMVETFPASRQGVGQALFGVGAMLGPSLGPTLGGWITDNWSWPWIFFVNVPLGLLAALLCATQLRDPPYLRARKRVRVDAPGIAFLVVGVACLQFVLERGHRDDWFESRRLSVLALTAAVALVAFVARELTTPRPVVELRVLRRRALAVGCTYGVLMGVGLYGSTFLFPVYTQSLLGWTAWSSGVAILPSSLATAITMVVTGRLVYRTGPRPLFAFGAVIFSVAMLAASRWTLQSGASDLFWPMVGRGVGLGAMFVPLSTSALRSLPPQEVPQGAALYSLFRQLGGSFGIAIITTVLAHRATAHRARLVEGMGWLDPVASGGLTSMTAAFQQRGLDFASARGVATAALDRLVGAQSSLEAFQDVYAWIALGFVMSLPLVFGFARRVPVQLSPVGPPARSPD